MHILRWRYASPPGAFWDGTAMAEDSAREDGSAEALREVRERYVLATVAGGVGVWDLDLATGALRLDAVIYALLGFDAAEPEGADLWPGRFHAADRECARVARQAALAPDAPR